MCSIGFATGTELSCRITGEVTAELQRRVRRARMICEGGA
jgi:hypothetical protein